MTNNHYILEGKELKLVDSMTWARWFETHRKERIVKQESIGDVHVSTVFLGLDHNFLPDGSALLFETMIFGGERDGETNRYSTYEEAERGHEKVVKSLSPQESKE